MYAHALTYPSLQARRARGRRTRRRAPIRRMGSPGAALAPQARLRQHMRAPGRQRAAQVSWGREIARVTAALANVAGLAALLYLLV